MRRSAGMLYLSGSGSVGARSNLSIIRAKTLCPTAYISNRQYTKRALAYSARALFVYWIDMQRQCCYAAFLPETEIRTSIRKIAAKPTPSRKVKLLPRTVAERMAAVTGSEKPYRLPFSGPMYFSPWM